MKRDIFSELGRITNPKKDAEFKKEYNKKEQIEHFAFLIKRESEGVCFEEYLQPLGYACETLINGNISHCSDYLKQLIFCGISGIAAAHDELILIKENAPDKYDFILKKVFSL